MIGRVSMYGSHSFIGKERNAYSRSCLGGWEAIWRGEGGWASIMTAIMVLNSLYNYIAYGKIRFKV